MTLLWLLLLLLFARKPQKHRQRKGLHATQSNAQFLTAVSALILHKNLVASFLFDIICLTLCSKNNIYSMYTKLV